MLVRDLDSKRANPAENANALAATPIEKDARYKRLCTPD
jgi:hypothetical protein